MTVRRIVPDFPARDLDASREFYVRVLGLDVAMDLGWIVPFSSSDNAAAQISVMQGDAARRAGA